MFGFSEKASPTAILSAIYQHQVVIEFEPDGKVIKIVKYASAITAETQQKQQFELLSMVAN